MGTAIVGVAAFMNPGNIATLQSPLHIVGIAFAILAYALAIALGIPYVWRWVRHFDAALKDLQHPILGALHSIFPGGILVLATMTVSVGPTLFPENVVLGLVAILAVIGIALTFVLGIGFVYILFASPNVAVENANGGWFIPPVVNIIVPMVLVPLMPRGDAETARLLLVVSYAAWGIGFFLFVIITALLYNRLVFHPLPGAPLAPSLWIGLGPIGVGGLALLRMAQGGAGEWGGECAVVHRRARVVGIRRVVAHRHRVVVVALSPRGQAALWHRLVGVHISPGRVHGKHFDSRSHVEAGSA
jgi:tellurite resistance protein TehA-like permease